MVLTEMDLVFPIWQGGGGAGLVIDLVMHDNLLVGLGAFANGIEQVKNGGA